MMREAFDPEPVLDGLKGFQRATVNHVISRFYGPEPTRRFLVADETGLGKSIVARGVIACAIRQLETDSSVDRIDVVYVCSNADIASQNISRLDVTGDPHLAFASRLTMIAKHSSQLAGRPGRFRKPVNLVSFTPGTSFDRGLQAGKAEERAMLYLLLEELRSFTGWERHGALRLLKGQVRDVTGFEGTVKRLADALDGGIDPRVVGRFEQEARGSLSRFDDLLHEMGRKDKVPDVLRADVRSLIQELRSHLAKASIDTLEPDLVILDEFQRFRHVLDETDPAGELAHHLFNYPAARVLLLSATPYKPFTYTEESATGEDHHNDFLRTLRFLAGGSTCLSVETVADRLATYRDAAIAGAPVGDLTTELEHELLKVMSRCERPELDRGMLSEHVVDAQPVTDDDLVGYVALKRVATAVGAPLPLDYWKSAPYFVNFMDGYQLADKVRAALKDPDKRAELLPLLARAPHLDRAALGRRQPIDFGNPRLRQLAGDTVGAGWWQLLWVPPSLPYLAPDGPYAEPFAADVTKRLIFSSWAATPTAVAALLSYDAERRLTENARPRGQETAARGASTTRLGYRLSDGRPQAMTTLAPFWPMPGLAAVADPLARCGRDDPPRTEALEGAIARELVPSLPGGPTSTAAAADAWYWAAALRRDDSLPPDLALKPDVLGVVRKHLAGEPGAEEGADDSAGLTAHVEAALRVRDGISLQEPPPDLAETLAGIAMHAPGNIAWRALGRLSHGRAGVTPRGHWLAAAILSSGLRSLFSRPESTLLLDCLLPDSVYWRAVLRYCAWGNLQSVLDEYLHHLANDESASEIDDARLAKLASVAANAMSLRPSTYRAFDPEAPGDDLSLTARFALRYGGRRQAEDTSRQPEVRRGFNSPFWPFVLATTSVGQEGIDFHWWCHSVCHWNTPANPVDFEQREGRIHRYGGHAVRRNIAARHRADILGSRPDDPWGRAYAMAGDEREAYGDFAPHWVYPGPSRIQRYVAPYPLSIDKVRYEHLKGDVALYRLTFGQPRQEDMLELLRRRGADGAERLSGIRLDLTPGKAPGPRAPTAAAGPAALSVNVPADRVGEKVPLASLRLVSERLPRPPQPSAPVTLPRGGRVQLPHPGGVWEIHAKWSPDAAVEVDVVAFSVTETRRIRGDDDFVFYNLRANPSGSVALQVLELGHQSIVTTPTSLDGQIDVLVVAAVIDGEATFAEVGAVTVEVVPAGGEPLMRATYEAATTEKSLELVEMYRRKGGWRLHAVGQGYDFALKELAVRYGVDVIEEDAP